MLSVLFLGIVALLGTGTRLTAPVLTMRRMYTQQDHIWGETLQLGVQAPYNNTYQLYLDKSYHLTMPSESGYSAENVNTNITDKVEIYEKEDCYKLTFSRLPVFAGNAFFLNRDHAVSPEEEIQIHASGDNEHIEGRWKNPTGYRIENAILVLTNRIVFLGDLEPGEEGTFSEKIQFLWKWRPGKNSEKISGFERYRVSGLCGERCDGADMGCTKERNRRCLPPRNDFQQ